MILSKSLIHNLYGFELAKAPANVNKKRDEILFQAKFSAFFDLLDIKESFLLNFMFREQDKGTGSLGACREERLAVFQLRRKEKRIMKRILLAFVVVSLILSSSMVGASEDSKFGIGVRGGFVFSQDDSIVDPVDGTKVDIDIDSAFCVGINTTYVMSDVLSMELSGDWVFDRETEFMTPTGSIGGGDISTIPVLLTLRIHIPVSSGFKPYIGGGVGWYFNSFDQNPLWIASNPGVNAELDDSFAWLANAGLEFFLTENVAFNIDGKYIWSSPDMNLTGTGYYNTYEIDLDGFVVGVGVKFYFQ